MIKISSEGTQGVLSGRLGPNVFEAAREMPGRRKWRGRELVFELTRANVDFLSARFPDAEWDLGDRGAELDQLQQMEADARKAKRLPPEAQHFDFKTVPRAHQREAFNLSKDKPCFGLFLEMGLGKTKIVLDTAAYLWAHGKIDTLLITAPNGVHTQWVDEQLAQHLPDWVPCKAVIYRSEQPKWWAQEWEATLSYADGLRVVSMHIDAFSTEKGVKFAREVLQTGHALWALDESVAIKTPGARRSKNVLKLAPLAPYRRILSGAPITRGVEDLFSQLKFLSEDILGFSSFYTFRNHFCITQSIPGAPTGAVQIVDYQNLDELHNKLASWTVRYRAQDCLDIPERITLRREVPLTSEQRRMYSDVKEEMFAQLEGGQIVTAEHMITRLLRLQQVLCGHLRDEEGTLHWIKTERNKVALEAAQEASAYGQSKVVIWARFQPDIDLLAETFKDWNPVTWDGRSSAEDRASAKNRFVNEPNVQAFIANPAAAGTGLDGLQHVANTMIYYSNSFKVSDRWQSEARLHRDGQKGTVRIIDLETPKTIDSYILKALTKKKDVADMALEIDRDDL